MQCQTQKCPALETICEQGFTTLKVETTEEECCPKYLCIPTATISPTCDPPQKLNCGFGQIMKLDTKPDGCQQFICVCKPLEECDPIEEPTEETPPGMERTVDKSGCCPIANLICKPEKCPKRESCPKFYISKKTKTPNDCCYKYTCKPPPDKCLYELSYLAAYTGGERQRSELEKEVVELLAGARWYDGPCRECECVRRNEFSEATCSVKECPSSLTHSDKDDYELLEEHIMGQCCPTIRRVKCRHYGKVYNVGEHWVMDDDPCKTGECIQTFLEVQKEIKIKICETNCELGWK